MADPRPTACGAVLKPHLLLTLLVACAAPVDDQPTPRPDPTAPIRPTGPTEDKPARVTCAELVFEHPDTQIDMRRADCKADVISEFFGHASDGTFSPNEYVEYYDECGFRLGQAWYWHWDGDVQATQGWEWRREIRFDDLGRQQIRTHTDQDRLKRVVMFEYNGDSDLPVRRIETQSNGWNYTNTVDWTFGWENGLLVREASPMQIREHSYRDGLRVQTVVTTWTQSYPYRQTDMHTFVHGADGIVEERVDERADGEVDEAVRTQWADGLPVVVEELRERDGALALERLTQYDWTCE